MIKKCNTCGREEWCNKKIKIGRYLFEKAKCPDWKPKVSDEWIKERMEIEKLRTEQFGRVN